jgi:hypothetical protein
VPDRTLCPDNSVFTRTSPGEFLAAMKTVINDPDAFVDDPLVLPCLS